MRLVLLLPLLLSVSSAQAEPPRWVPGMPWQPLAPYVVMGQDEPGYRNWYLASPAHAAQVRSLNTYLATYGVAGVVPTWQLLRTASDWYKCAAPAFEVPPTEEWPNLVQTLRYVREQVIPAVGPVEPVSVYRNPALNQCAGGARESAHRYMQAVDLVPLQPITRGAMMERLCAVHARTGQGYGVGLGFYVGLRFHVDSRKFRTWGTNDHGSVACARSFELAHAAEATALLEPQPPSSAPAASTNSIQVPQS